MKNASLITAGVLSISALITILIINNRTPVDSSSAPANTAVPEEVITCPAERPVLCPNETCAATITQCNPSIPTSVIEPSAVPSESPTSSEQAQNLNNSQTNQINNSAFTNDLDSDDGGLSNESEDNTEISPAGTSVDNDVRQEVTTPAPAPMN
jgi:hypothetical protein